MKSFFFVFEVNFELQEVFRKKIGMLLARDKILPLTSAKLLTNSGQTVAHQKWACLPFSDHTLSVKVEKKKREKKESKNNNNMSSNHLYPCSYCNLNNQTPTLNQYLGTKQLVVTPFKKTCFGFLYFSTLCIFLQAQFCRVCIVAILKG